MHNFPENPALAPCLAELELRFRLRRPGRSVRAVVSEVQAALVDARLGSHLDRVRIAAAVEEAIDTLLLVGNFEATASDLRGEQALNVRRGLLHMVRQRGALEPFCDRRLRVRVHLGAGVVRVALTHEGPPMQLENRAAGAGGGTVSLLMGSLWLRTRRMMDEAYFDPSGRTLTLSRRLAPGPAGSEPDAASRQALVVDSDARRGSRLRRHLARHGFDARLAPADAEALAALARQRPDLAIIGTPSARSPAADLETIELVRGLSGRGLALPVFVLADAADGAFAAAALAAGAVDSVDPRDLKPELARALARFEGARTACRLLMFGQELDEAACRFELPNEPELISPLTLRLLSSAARLRSFDPIETARVGTALREALLNAMEHGNLEVCSALREDGGGAYHELIARRRREPPYSGRRVGIVSRQSRAAISFVIRDQGPGFDPGGYEIPRNAKNLERPSGRGLVLIRAFMDEVRFNDAGNEITMINRHAPRARVRSRNGKPGA